MPRTTGALGATPATTSLRARAWTLMRNFGQRRESFILADLTARLSEPWEKSADRSNLQRYLKALTRAGYLRVTSGCHGHDMVYRMLRDTGPLSPILRASTNAVFDPNDGVEHVLGDAP